MILDVYKTELFRFDEDFSDAALIGTDEAGRGPGAGPVYAAAVCFEKVDSGVLSLLCGLNDSKKITAKRRQELYLNIKKCAIYSVASASVEEIEKINILQASLLAMRRACEEVISKIKRENIQIIVDGKQTIPACAYSQKNVIKGDSKSASIAAASILAKVERDMFMHHLHCQFPRYNWAQNKGYLTKEHIYMIKKFGTTCWHRKKFVRNIQRPQERL